jgi:ATP-binding cassette subfamily B protein
MGRFTTDLAALENSLSWVMASLVLNATNVAVSAVVLFTLEWRLALATLVGLVVCVLAPRRFSDRAGEVGYEKKRVEADLASGLQENVTAQPAVKAFGLEGRSIATFVRESLRWSTVARQFYFQSNLTERTPNVVILITEVIVMGGGILLVFYGDLTLGTVVAFHALFLNLSSSIEGLTTVVPALLQSMGGVQRIEELLAEPADEAPTPEPAAGAGTVPAGGGAVTFDRVTFSYDGARPSLEEVSFDVPAGAYVALVGGSGSGKSTALNLLLRFYEIREGAVHLDGVDIRQIPRPTLRARLGVVFQENLLFNVSIRENIRLGRPEATDAEVESAARAAEIHEAITALPQGYDTPAGERGSHLSGGQRQRIAIARALLRNPAILVLDEATSALDPATEESVNATLRTVAHGRTVLAVTHRLAAIVHADRIHVFAGGRVIESGRHAELLARRGRYAELWQKQSGFSLSDSGDQAEIQPERLRRFPILQELDDAILADLAGLLVTEVYAAGRGVVQEGEPGDRFYIIARGKVRVSRRRADGGEETVAMLDDGDYFGEIALISAVPRTATVTTVTPAILLSLRRRHFDRLLQRVPQIRARLTAPRESGRDAAGGGG